MTINYYLDLLFKLVVVTLLVIILTFNAAVWAYVLLVLLQGPPIPGG